MSDGHFTRLLECVQCYEEFGSLACLRPAHKPVGWTDMGVISSTTVTYTGLWPKWPQKMFYEEDPWINREE